MNEVIGVLDPRSSWVFKTVTQTVSCVLYDLKRHWIAVMASPGVAQHYVKEPLLVFY